MQTFSYEFHTHTQAHTHTHVRTHACTRTHALDTSNNAYQLLQQCTIAIIALECYTY